MNEFKSVDETIDFAIGKEEEAFEFYMALAGRMARAEMRKIFEQFAAEEQGHKAKLQEIRQGRQPWPAKANIPDLKISDYLVEIQPSANPTYQEALLLAMQSEKAAFRLYTDLAALAGDPAISAIFASLAQEEAYHKLRFEIEYDEGILTEN